jgi:hypothetical protein
LLSVSGFVLVDYYKYCFFSVFCEK